MIPLSRICPGPVRNPADIQRLTPGRPPGRCGRHPGPTRISARFPASPTPAGEAFAPFAPAPFPLFPLFFPPSLPKEKGLRSSSQPSKFGGGRWATRTPGLWFRRPTLYPPELIAHKKNHIKFRPSVKTDRTGAGWAKDSRPGRGAGIQLPEIPRPVRGLPEPGGSRRCPALSPAMQGWLRGPLPGPGQSHNLIASKGPWFTGGVLPRATHKRRSAG